jgi:hypothetical protein
MNGVNLAKFDTDPKWYPDLAQGGTDFKIAFTYYLSFHPERVNAIRNYLGPQLKFKEGDVKLFRAIYKQELNNVLYEGQYLKSILDYRRFRIMYDLAYNKDKIPIFEPITNHRALIIIDYLAQNSKIFDPFSSRIKEAQYEEILNTINSLFLRRGPPAPPSNTNRPPRGRGRIRGSRRYRYI